MAGLGVVLDVRRTKSTTTNPSIISKTLMLKHFTPASSPLATPTSFLDACSLCNKKLSLGMDIYMYRGDGAFCSVECRDRQIFMDEEAIWREKHYFPISTTSNARRTRATGGGLFAY